MMQQVKFETSMKNIPLGGNKEYVMQLTKSIRKVVNPKLVILLCYTCEVEAWIVATVGNTSCFRINENDQFPVQLSVYVASKFQVAHKLC